MRRQFAVFDRPQRGVACALAIREAVGALGLRVPLRGVGSRALRGVPGEWQLFEVLLDPD